MTDHRAWYTEQDRLQRLEERRAAEADPKTETQESPPAGPFCRLCRHPVKWGWNAWDKVTCPNCGASSVPVPYLVRR